MAFSNSKTNFSAAKRELFTMVTFTRSIKHYLLGKKVKIVIDHRALQWLHNIKGADGLTHRPGKRIDHADGISRIPIVNQATTSQRRNLDKPETMKFFELTHKFGNFFEIKNSLALCISSNFKISARSARSFKRTFLYHFQESINSPLFAQRIDDHVIYELVKEKHFLKIDFRYFATIIRGNDESC